MLKQIISKYTKDKNGNYVSAVLDPDEYRKINGNTTLTDISSGILPRKMPLLNINPLHRYCISEKTPKEIHIPLILSKADYMSSSHAGKFVFTYDINELHEYYTCYRNIDLDLNNIFVAKSLYSYMNYDATYFGYRNGMKFPHHFYVYYDFEITESATPDVDPVTGMRFYDRVWPYFTDIEDELYNYEEYSNYDDIIGGEASQACESLYSVHGEEFNVDLLRDIFDYVNDMIKEHKSIYDIYKFKAYSKCRKSLISRGAQDIEVTPYIPPFALNMALYDYNLDYIQSNSEFPTEYSGTPCTDVIVNALDYQIAFLKSGNNLENLQIIKDIEEGNIVLIFDVDTNYNPDIN